MGNIKYCFIRQNYYDEHPELKKILDQFDESKHNIRAHLCLSINFNGNNILVPLRRELGACKRKFGTIGFAVPSLKRPNAGLDYRYIMVINDEKYLRFDIPRISNSQIRRIEDNYSTIEKEATDYIKHYVRIAKKNRVEKTALFKESSLVNFEQELGVFSSEGKP